MDLQTRFPMWTRGLDGMNTGRFRLSDLTWEHFQRSVALLQLLDVARRFALWLKGGSKSVESAGLEAIAKREVLPGETWDGRKRISRTRFVLEHPINTDDPEVQEFLNKLEAWAQGAQWGTVFDFEEEPR